MFYRTVYSPAIVPEVPSSYSEMDVPGIRHTAAFLLGFIRNRSADHGYRDVGDGVLGLLYEGQEGCVGALSECRFAQIQIFVLIGGVQAYGNGIQYLGQIRNDVPAVDKVPESVRVQADLGADLRAYHPRDVQELIQALRGLSVSAEHYLVGIGRPGTYLRLDLLGGRFMDQP